MNLKRLGIVIAVLIYLLLSTWAAHLVPDTPWPVAVLVGPLMGACAATFLAWVIWGGLIPLWRWLREKPQKPEVPLTKAMSLERWHALYELGIDPDTHKCEYGWVKEGETQSRWGCRPCMEVEKELRR